jgi:hypothetical protein
MLAKMSSQVKYIPEVSKYRGPVSQIRLWHLGGEQLGWKASRPKGKPFELIL